MKLPNGERALVDLAKLRDYCLNPIHLRGRHKARVFASRLGIARKDADFLRAALFAAARDAEAVPTKQDAYGQRYMLDFEMTGPNGTAMVRSSWIVLTGENIPRMTTCYVL